MRAGVADGKALAGLPCRQQPSRRCAIEHSVADDAVLLTGERAADRWPHDDGAARKPLADIVIGIAKHFQDNALTQECAKRLSRRTTQAHMDMPFGKALHPVQARDFGAEPRTNRAVGVADIIGQLHFLAPFEHRLCIMDHLRIKAVGHFIAECWDAEAARAVGRIDLGKDGVEIEIVQMLRAATNLTQQLGTADDFIKAAIAKLGQNLAHFFGNEGHQVDHLFRGAREFFAQGFVLNTDPDGAGVGMALAHHDAAHGDKAKRADTKFFRTQNRGNHNVASGFQPAIGP